MFKVAHCQQPKGVINEINKFIIILSAFSLMLTNRNFIPRYSSICHYFRCLPVDYIARYRAFIIIIFIPFLIPVFQYKLPY